MSSSNDISSILTPGCSVYCITVKQAISQVMSTPSLSVSPDSIQIYRSSRRLLDRYDKYTRRLNSITIGFSVSIYTTQVLASASLSNLQSSFGASNSFIQALQTLASSNGILALQNVHVSSLRVSKVLVVNPQQSSSSAYNYKYLAVLVLLVIIGYTIHYYNTRKTIIISDPPSDNSDLLPGLVALVKLSDNKVVAVFDTNHSAKEAVILLKLRGIMTRYHRLFSLIISS